MTALLESDFAAYAPERASSNAYVRPRIAVKERVGALCRGLLDAAHTAGLAGLALDASDERPSIWNKRSVTEQWCFVWRDREARAALERRSPVQGGLGGLMQNPTPWDRHAFVGVRLDARGLSVGLWVHADAWADVQTLRARADGPTVRAALRPLPEGFALEPGGASAREVEGAGVRAAVEAAVEAQGFFAVRRALSAAGAAALGGALDAWVVEGAAALWGLYVACAWSEGEAEGEGELREALSREAASRARVHAEALEEEQRWEARKRDELERQRAQPEKGTWGALRASLPSGRASGAGRGVRTEARRVAESRRVEAGPAAAVVRPASVTVLTRGARVRVCEGPFAGAVGAVTELFADGTAKVSFGALSVRVRAAALAAG